jgi:hypothetical protein
LSGSPAGVGVTSPMRKVEASLGRTKFELEETPTPGVVKITRRNSDGEREFFVPVSLIIEYAIGKAQAAMKKAMGA